MQQLEVQVFGQKVLEPDLFVVLVQPVVESFVVLLSVFVVFEFVFVVFLSSFANLMMQKMAWKVLI